MPMHRPGPYQIQAAIAAVHAAARRYADTDWGRIRALYDRSANERALELALNPAERELLTRRLTL